MRRRRPRRARHQPHPRENRALLWLLVAISAMGALCQFTTFHYHIGMR